MALSALIFDLDGTLIDTTAAHARAWCRAFDEFGFHVPTDRIALEIGKGGSLLVPALVGQRAEQQHGDALRDAQTGIYLEIIREEGVRVFPRVRELFEALRARGLQIAVATAADEESLAEALDQAGLRDLIESIDAVIHDDDVARSKPHPEAVQPAVEQLGLAPSQCAFVGDTSYDVEACKRAGLVCLGVTSGPHDAARLRRAGARAVYADVADLLDDLGAALAAAAPGQEPLTGPLLDGLMDAALAQARAALEQGEVPIGAVLARTDGTVVASGFNEARRLKSPVAHAEMRVLQQAAGRLADDVTNLVLATTLEPCVMCLGAAMTARVDTVVYALPAPSNGGVDRCDPVETPGAVLPRLVGGVRRDESRALLHEWLVRHPDDAFVRDLLERLPAEPAPAE
ncbi:MAG: HAD-IA family hydrolase [Rhodothermales bacterium]|nr:HAD-IA family hydrolase [Rhodothermales bacterium]